MVMKPKFCKGIVIAHGKSELLLAEHIKSNVHLPIEIYAESNGKTSIQIYIFYLCCRAFVACLSHFFQNSYNL